MAEPLQQADSDLKDEVDLQDLLRAVLDTRVWAITALVVVALIYWAVIVVVNLVKPEVYRYESRIEFVFSGVHEQQYPNGSPYSLSDLIAPVVLNTVYEKNKLEDFLDRQVFVGSFTIEPYTPEREFILEKYSNLLGNKSLSPPEIEELQSKLDSELKMSALDSATLVFSSSGSSGIPKEMIKTLLREIPAEWSRHMIDDRGVIRSDKQIYTSKVVDTVMVDRLDYLIMFEVILERLRLLEENIDTIKSMPNGLVVIDNNSGLGLPDLERAAEDMRRYQIGPLLNPIRTLGIAKDVQTVELYFNNELAELSRDSKILTAKKSNVEKAYNNYIQFDMASGSKAGDGLSTGSIIPQFGAEFLDRIMELTNMGADLEYRQGLNNQLLSLANELADADGERDRIEQLINALKGKQGELVTTSLRSSYEDKLLEELPRLLDQLKTYFDICTRLYLKLSTDQLGSAGELYRHADGEVDIYVSNNVLNFANFRLFFIVCFLALVIVVPISMIRNNLKNPK